MVANYYLHFILGNSSKVEDTLLTDFYSRCKWLVWDIESLIFKLNFLVFHFNTFISYITSFLVFHTKVTYLFKIPTHLVERIIPPLLTNQVLFTARSCYL